MACLVLALVACHDRAAPKSIEHATCCCEYQLWSPTTSYRVLLESKCDAIEGRCVYDATCSSR